MLNVKCSSLLPCCLQSLKHAKKHTEKQDRGNAIASTAVFCHIVRKKTQCIAIIQAVLIPTA